MCGTYTSLYMMRRLTLDEKFELALSVAEECVQPEELRILLEKKPNIVAYDGFEPSGRMHIAQARGHGFGLPWHAYDASSHHADCSLLICCCRGS